MLSLLIPAVFFVSLTGLTVMVSGHKFGACAPVTLFASVYILFFSQFLTGSFTPGLVLLPLLACGGAALLVYAFIRRPQRFRLFLTPGLAAFLWVILFFFIVDLGRSFTLWDEFSHWGVMVKEMIRTGKFYCEPVSNLQFHRNYPPFVQLFELLWCRLAGGYSESRATLAVHVMLFSILVPPAAEHLPGGRRRGWAVRTFCLVLIMAILVSALDTAGTFNSIYQDLLLAAIFVHGFLPVLTEDVFKDVFSLISVIMTVGAIILTKQMGLAFILVIWGFYLLSLLLALYGRRAGTMFRPAGLAAGTLVLFAFPFLVNRLWSSYTNSLGLSGQFDLDQLSVSGFMDILTGADRGPRRSAMKYYIQSLIEKPLYDGFIKISYAGFVILVLLLIWVLWHRNKGLLSGEKALLLAVILTGGSAGYAFTMLVLYMFCFSQEEMSRLASYSRYISCWVEAEMMILLLLALLLLSRRKSRLLRTESMAVLAALMLLISGPGVLKTLVPQGIYGDKYADFRAHAVFLEEHTEPDTTTYMVADSDATLQYFVFYMNTDRLITYKFIDIMDMDFEADPARTGRLLDNIASCQYVYVVNVNDNITDNFSPLVNDANLKENTLYSVSSTDQGIELSETASWAGPSGAD